jgi:hypothetical protein
MLSFFRLEGPAVMPKQKTGLFAAKKKPTAVFAADGFFFL